MERIKDKIYELEKFLDELKLIIPSSYNEYSENLEKKAACERYFEKIVESIISISNLICRKERFEMNDKPRSLNILAENKIIDENLLRKLKNAKGMRNIIAHKYGEVDDTIVFESVTKELIIDSKEFISKIIKYLQ